jgi:hypothetical protein
MPAPDLTLKIIEMRDFPVPQLDGTVLQQKRVVFYLGKLGPFTEYFPNEGFNQGQVNLRIDALKHEVEGMHR